MDRVGVDNISVLGMPPPDFVSLAADAGCQHVSLRLRRMDLNPHGYPDFSLVDDAALRRETIARMKDRGVSLALGEGLSIRPGGSVRDLARDLEVMVDLGAKLVNTVSFDPDLDRTFDEYCVMAEMTADAGLDLSIEFTPLLTIKTLDAALDMIRRVGRPHMRILVDTMHATRSGCMAADLAAVDPALFGYIQISDGPLTPAKPNYMDEAMHERMIPGEGEMPLEAMLSALPRHLVVSCETPLRNLAQAGVPPLERVRRAVEGARRILARIDAPQTAASA